MRHSYLESSLRTKLVTKVTKMGKFFAFTIILSSILIAHIICPRPPKIKKSEDPEANQSISNADHSETRDVKDDQVANLEEESSEDEETENTPDIDEEESEPSLPFLTCTIFKDNFACNTMCSILGSIYGTPITSGVCEEAKECECQVLAKATLENYWNEKFFAKNTLREIQQDKKLSGKIFEVLKTPFRTAQQTIEDLKPFLSTSQISSLRVRNKAAQKIFSKDGEFDKVAVEKYVASKLKSAEKPSEGFDYKKTLIDTLNSPDNKDIVDYIINEIRQSKNKLLNSVIEDYIKEHNIKIQEPPIDFTGEGSIIDILDTAVMNELIKPPPRENTLKLTGLRSKSKKSSAKTANKSSTQLISSAGPTNTSKQSSAVTNTESSNEPDEFPVFPTTTDESRWILKDFDKTKVDRLKKGKKCWEDEDFGYEVCLRKDSSSARLSWENSTDSVQIEVLDNGDIKQCFYFVEWQTDSGRYVAFDIKIKTCSERGIQEETWQFPKTGFKLTKGADGSIKKKWNGKEDLELLEKYKGFIKAWCAHNDYFVGKGNCVITLS